MSEYSPNSYADDPRKVRLTKEERDIARASGLSDIEYAIQKLRFLQVCKDYPEKYMRRG
jgi:hypothetical protein